MVQLHITPKVFIGPPGTGKTTTLVKTTEKEALVVKPEEFLFLSFTKVASQTIINRLSSSDDIRLKACSGSVKTLHSFTFTALGLDVDRMMDQKDWDNCFKELAAEDPEINDVVMVSLNVIMMKM